MTTHHIDPSVYDNIDFYLANADDSTDLSTMATDNSVDVLTKHINEIEVDEKQTIITKESIKYCELSDNNILADNILKKLSTSLDVDSSSLFSLPTSTTVTLSGKIDNLIFMEEELIKILEPTENIVAIKCNFGEKYFQGYHEIQKIKVSNRGRKKHIKIKRPRKKQGSGKHFNSQISFIIKRNSDEILLNPQPKPFKFKLFRTGGIQLPGATLDILPDIVSKTDFIVQLLKSSLNNPEIKLVSLNPFMKNYKFTVELSPNQLIDLHILQQIFLKFKDPTIDLPNDLESYFHLYNSFCEHPMIRDTKYSFEDTKLCVKFHTPTQENHNKTVRINIFMSGKINILGAFNDDITSQIYMFLLDIFNKFYNFIIVDPNDDDDEYVLLEYFDNIIFDPKLYNVLGITNLISSFPLLN